MYAALPISYWENSFINQLYILWPYVILYYFALLKRYLTFPIDLIVSVVINECDDFIFSIEMQSVLYHIAYIFYLAYIFKENSSRD